MAPAAPQADDAPTEPSVPPKQRFQLRASSQTVKLNNPQIETDTEPFRSNPLLQGHSTLIFALIGTETTLSIQVTRRFLIGRPSRDIKVDLDLTPYGALEAGVSRQHAVLYRTPHNISLADMGSTNGTYLNGTRLVAHQPRLLRDGDEVGFGMLRFHLALTD